MACGPWQSLNTVAPSQEGGTQLGHSESFYFVDPRDGDYGVEYNRPSREEIELVAKGKGYLGRIQARITAYPLDTELPAIDRGSSEGS